MENELIDTSTLYDLDSNNIVGDSNDDLSHDIAVNLLNELQSISDQQEDNQEEIVENEQIDYSQQLSDINNSLDTLHNDIVGLSSAIGEMQGSIESIPNEISMIFSDFIDFQYVLLSIYLGILIAILFFMGLKK